VSPPAYHGRVVTETRTHSVSLVSKDPSHSVDHFYKYRGEQLPQVDDVIEVVRFHHGRPVRARVTFVDANSSSPIRAREID
jgi:hypothetical protein